MSEINITETVRDMTHSTYKMIIGMLENYPVESVIKVLKENVAEYEQSKSKIL